jgi:hypothetical protein
VQNSPCGHPARTPEIDRCPPGTDDIIRSWILLFGVLPIDYDDLSLIALEPEPRAGVAARCSNASSA